MKKSIKLKQPKCVQTVLNFEAIKKFYWYLTKSNELKKLNTGLNKSQKRVEGEVILELTVRSCTTVKFVFNEPKI